MSNEDSPTFSTAISSSAPTVNSNHSSDLTILLETAKQRFVARNPTSGRLFEEATNYLPGGNTRTLLYAAPFPICMKEGKNYQVFDEDGHVYTDFVGELTAGLYGHTQPIIQKSIINTVNNIGLSLGSTTAQEARYAQLLCARFHLDKVRFCNSGTEANLHALAGARHFTGKRRVVVFSGGYHGAVLGFSNGVQTNGVDRHDWVIGRYNDVEGAKRLIEEQDDIAAVLVEGMQGSGGCIPGTKEFLFQIQESAKKAGACFILDEVMTSRLGPSGLQAILGLSPDLTVMGKYLGGGLAFGTFGGRAEVMAVYDPRSPHSLTHSGTFNNNTLAMNAGFAGLSEVWTPDVAVEFNKLGDEFRTELQQIAEGTKMCVTGLGALNTVHFQINGLKEVSCIQELEEDVGLKDLFYLEMLEEGFWVTRRGMTALILGTPKSELDRFLASVGKFLAKYQSLVTLTT